MQPGPAVVSLPCPQCGHPDQLKIGQSCFDSQLRWYESATCRGCGLVTEADGDGFPPEIVRSRLLAEQGVWRVRLDEVVSMANVARALSRYLGVGLKEALELLRDEEGFYRGTETEAQWLAQGLQALGETPRVCAEA